MAMAIAVAMAMALAMPMAMAMLMAMATAASVAMGIAMGVASCPNCRLRVRKTSGHKCTNFCFQMGCTNFRVHHFVLVSQPMSAYIFKYVMYLYCFSGALTFRCTTFVGAPFGAARRPCTNFWDPLFATISQAGQTGKASPASRAIPSCQQIQTSQRAKFPKLGASSQDALAWLAHLAGQAWPTTMVMASPAGSAS